MKKKNPPTQMSRGTFLRGLGGTLLSLPIADFLWCGEKIVFAQGNVAPKRFFTLFYPNGASNDYYTFDKSIQPFTLRGLAPLTNLFVNVTNPASLGKSTGGAPFDPHGNGAATIFTGMDIPKAKAFSQAGGATIDQFIADKLNPPTMLKTLVCGVMSTELLHDTMFGIHTRVRSWRGNDKPVTCLRTPAAVFAQLFGNGFENLVNKDATYRLHQKTVLDAVMSQYREVTSERYGLSTAGKARLTDHMDEVNDLQKKLQEQAEELAQECREPPATPAKFAADIPYNQFDQAFRTMTDLLVFALKCDIVRFGHISFGGIAQYYRVGDVNISLSGHDAAHRSAALYAQNNAANLHNTYAVFYNRYVRKYHDLFAGFLEKLNKVSDSNGKSILSNSLFLVGTDLADQARLGHKTQPASMLMCGSAGGKIPVSKAGERMTAGVTNNDVLAACARLLDVPVDQWGPAGYNTKKLFG